MKTQGFKVLLGPLLLVLSLIPQTGAIAKDSLAQGTPPNSIFVPVIFNNYDPNAYYAVQDSYISENYPDKNYGQSMYLFAGYDSDTSANVKDPVSKTVRGLIRFDLSPIPIGQGVSKAILKISYGAYLDYQGSSRTITTYRISQDWSEMGVTWNTAPAIAEPYGSVNIVADTSWRYVEIDVTSLVNGWLQGGFPNYGLMLRGPEDLPGFYRGFATRETTEPPILKITYP